MKCWYGCMSRQVIQDNYMDGCLCVCVVCVVCVWCSGDLSQPNSLSLSLSLSLIQFSQSLSLFSIPNTNLLPPVRHIHCGGCHPIIVVVRNKDILHTRPGRGFAYRVSRGGWGRQKTKPCVLQEKRYQGVADSVSLLLSKGSSVIHLVSICTKMSRPFTSLSPADFQLHHHVYTCVPRIGRVL